MKPTLLFLPGLVAAVLLIGSMTSPASESPDTGEETGDSIRAAENDPAQDRYSREGPEVAAAWAPVLEEVRRGTARLLHDGKPVALATTVGSGGWLLTKSSEIHTSKGKALEDLTAQFPGGITLTVKISDIHNRYDLALLKVEATGLTPVEWESEAVPGPGSYLAAVGPEKLPVAIGVVSVTPRNLDEFHKGFLGIAVEKQDGSLKISQVGEDSAASEAGLLKDDVLVSINGQEMETVSDFVRKIAAHKPYDTVKVLVRRGAEDKELSATLRGREGNQVGLIEDLRNLMSGALSRNRSGYPAALQHDMVLAPAECGGPVVNLDGKVVGINIARSGRIECFAIPSATVVNLLTRLDTGKFARPELEDLRKEVKNAEALLNRVRRDAERLKEQLKEAEDG